MSQTIKLQKLLNNLWTAVDVCNEYGVTAMAVHLWRKRGLPALAIPGNDRPAIRFVPEDVKAWCKREDIHPVSAKTVRRKKAA